MRGDRHRNEEVALINAIKMINDKLEMKWMDYNSVQMGRYQKKVNVLRGSIQNRSLA